MNQDINQDDLQKKMEEYHEFLLKNAAMTFSLEGTSKDLKAILKRKAMYSSTCLNYLNEIVKNITKHKSKPLQLDLIRKGGALYTFFEHITSEMKITDTMINVIFQRLIDKETTIDPQKEETGEPENG